MKIFIDGKAETVWPKELEPEPGQPTGEEPHISRDGKGGWNVGVNYCRYCRQIVYTQGDFERARKEFNAGTRCNAAPWPD